MLNDHGSQAEQGWVDDAVSASLLSLVDHHTYMCTTLASTLLICSTSSPTSVCWMISEEEAFRWTATRFWCGRARWAKEANIGRTVISVEREACVCVCDRKERNVQLEQVR